MENRVSLKTNVSQLAESVAPEQPSIQMALGRKNDSTHAQFTHKALDYLKQLEHWIPIWIVSAATVAQYAEPQWEPATMQGKFPALRSVIVWCTNAKTISTYLLISISRDPTTGMVDVGFKVENEVVSVSTRFTDLATSGQVDVEGDTC
jgi:hypothetical protein